MLEKLLAFLGMESKDVLLDAAWKNLEDYRIRYKDIDNKAVWTITATGILISFVNLNKPTNDISNISRILYIFSLIAFLIAILLSIGTLLVRSYIALSTHDLEEYFDKDRKTQTEYIIVSISQYEDTIAKAIDSKLKYLRHSLYMLVVGLISLIIYSIIR